jgi:hypothetical protein
MSKKKQIEKLTFKVVGKLGDGRPIVSNCFVWYDTIGLPVADLLGLLKSKNIMMSWQHFYDDAKKAGWSRDRILSVLSEAIFEVYGKDFRDAVIKAMQDYDGE